MFGPSEFRALVSGQKRGVGAAFLRAAFRVLEVPYTAAVRWRNRRYDSGRAPVTRVDAPVVSVGNLTLGGTGKTPTVEWLARWFADRGVRVGLVSRGYGATSGRVNDEALELARNLPDVPHVQDADRVRGAQRPLPGTVASSSSWTTGFNIAASLAISTSCWSTRSSHSVLATSSRAARCANRSMVGVERRC